MCIGSQNLSMNREILNDKVVDHSIPDFGQNLSQSVHLSVIAK